LATKAWKPQTALLEQDDLDIAYACLQAWERDTPKKQPQRLFAFFNSGEHSGASQVHRHLQFLPIEDMAGSSGGDWRPLLDRMTGKRPRHLPPCQDPSLPFLHYATPLFEKIKPQNLYSKYMHLLRAAVSGLKEGNAEAHLDYNVNVEQDGEAIISYNLAMTTNMMAIIPRRSEAAEVPILGKDSSSVSINGTILGGTLMVKAEDEWKALRETPALLDEVLRTIGYPVSASGDIDKTKL
jgi:sulfate adenylyltransferase (ADP) / ATP adenylyltransferase